MKFPIDQHKTNVAYSAELIIKEEQRLTRIYEGLCKSRIEHNFYVAQIKEAEDRGLDSFDNERFMIKRKPKQQPDLSATPPGETP